MNPITFPNRAALRRWLEENHQSERECWVVSYRGKHPLPDALPYLDVVEEALCFGWIDSTQKKIDDGKPIQHFTPRRKRSKWCERNLIRCRRLVQLGEMTPAGLAAAPDLDPSRFVFEDWVLDAIKSDKTAWKNYNSFPETYRRIRVDFIQGYRQSNREEEAQEALRKFVQYCHDGKMLPGWDDFGRLT